MPASISGIGQVIIPEPLQLVGESRKPGEFEGFLERALRNVEAMRSESTQAVQSFLSGESEDLHTAALATQKAELTFELGLQVRNKIVQAYQEIMRMPM